jgi:hydroxymethylpyrimidine/phosphomethylpyrimidine kinase
VMVSKSGFHLLNPDAKATLIRELLPLALIVTPNIPEAEVMTDLQIRNLAEMEKAARAIARMGAKYVLLKGGHLADDSTDVLYNGKEFRHLRCPKIDTKNTHGTGCTLSSAIASQLALGRSIEEAVSLAKDYITTAIRHSLCIGKGTGPTNHFYALYKKAGIIQ